MKRTVVAIAILCAISQMSMAQFGGFGGFGGGFAGFGGSQASSTSAKYSQKFENLNYAADDKAYHTLDIYIPDSTLTSYPVIIHTYGSAWMMNSGKGMADINTIVAAYLNAGYAVVCPNHRSSSDAKYPAQINDIKAVIRFCRAKAGDYKLDTSFIGISGFSSGAHLAALAGATNGVKEFTLGKASADIEGKVGPYLDYSSNVNAVCEWSGPINLMDMDCGGPRNMNPSPEEMVVGVPMEGGEDQYGLFNPITYIKKGMPAVMMFHGKKDTTVPYCQSEQYAKALTAAGVENKVIYVEDGGHGVNMYTEENLKLMLEFMDSQRKKVQSSK